MKLLTYTLLVVLLCTFAHGQNIGLVTDTNGTVVSSRTNPLTFTNDLQLATLTNATGPNLVVADANGTLSTGSVPSGAAAVGSTLTADGAGGSSFVASRTVSRELTNSETKVNWTNLTVTAATNYVAGLGQFTLDANSTYRVETLILVSSPNSFTNHANALVLSSPLGTNAGVQNLGWTISTAIFQTVQAQQSATSINLGVMGTATGFRQMPSHLLIRNTTTNSITLSYHWTTLNDSTNSLTLEAGSTISVTKIAP